MKQWIHDKYILFFLYINTAPPKLEDQRSSPNAIIIGEYETLTLKCYATGKPSPVISWYRTVETDDGQMTKEGMYLFYLPFIIIVLRLFLLFNKGIREAINRKKNGKLWIEYQETLLSTLWIDIREKCLESYECTSGKIVWE